MSGYTKLFNSILASTIWREGKETKILWITMLAMADKDGMVEASIPGLADMARLTVPETETALEILQSPDSYSRTKDHDGRRIEPVKGGWLVLNHGIYREKMNADERRNYLRLKQQESRMRKKGCQQSVNNCSDLSTESTQAESREQRADPEAEKQKKKKRKTVVVSEFSRGGVEVPETYSPWCSDAIRDWAEYRWERNQFQYEPSGWKAFLTKLKGFSEGEVVAAILDSMANQWSGIFPKTGVAVEREIDYANAPGDSVDFATWWLETRARVDAEELAAQGPQEVED
jgi:hypothetical protein